jgi:hypothetical protein
MTLADPDYTPAFIESLRLTVRRSCECAGGLVACVHLLLRAAGSACEQLYLLWRRSLSVIPPSAASRCPDAPVIRRMRCPNRSAAACEDTEGPNRTASWQLSHDQSLAKALQRLAEQATASINTMSSARKTISPSPARQC